MKYFLYKDNVYRLRDGIYYQKTGVFGEPAVTIQPRLALPLKKNQANALINTWYKNNREKWTYQGEKFKHLDYFEGNKDYLLKIIINLKQYPVGKYGQLYYKIYHQGYVWNAKYNPNAEAMMLYKGDSFHKYTSITNCAPVWNITQKCYV